MKPGITKPLSKLRGIWGAWVNPKNLKVLRRRLLRRVLRGTALKNEDSAETGGRVR